MCNDLSITFTYGRIPYGLLQTLRSQSNCVLEAGIDVSVYARTELSTTVRTAASTSNPVINKRRCSDAAGCRWCVQSRGFACNEVKFLVILTGFSALCSLFVCVARRNRARNIASRGPPRVGEYSARTPQGYNFFW